MADTKTYTVYRSMSGNGKDYARGDEREMTEADAAPLVATGALALKGEVPMERGDPVRHMFGTAKGSSPANVELDRARSDLSELRQQHDDLGKAHAEAIDTLRSGHQTELRDLSERSLTTLGEIEKDRDAQRQRADRAEGELADANTALTELRDLSERSQMTLGAIEKDRNAQRERADRAEGELADANTALTSLRDELTAAKSALADLQADPRLTADVTKQSTKK